MDMIRQQLLLIDGEIIGSAPEERFSRVKMIIVFQ